MRARDADAVVRNMYGIRDGSHDHLALDNEFIARGNAQRISLSALIFYFYIFCAVTAVIFGGHDRGCAEEIGSK